MRDFSVHFARNVLQVFAPKLLPYHALAIALSAACIFSGFDWSYFLATRSETLRDLALPATLLGFFVPFFLPLIVFMYAVYRRDGALRIAAYAIAQAALAGVLVSWFYKALTGRAHPEIFSNAPLADITRVFHFGFLKSGVFWGWPSSHTTVAFALGVALFLLYRSRPVIAYSSLAFALYIGLGVSMTIHWFSDFLAGAIFGSLIGVTVANDFARRARR